MTKIFKVGGAVRDELLGVKSKDIDFAVEAESFGAMRDFILARGGKIFLETPEHFTIRANVPVLGSADYVLCRKDGTYTDGRRPDSVSVGTILDDLARRDFTINAIAINVVDGTVIDPHGGIDDCKYKIIKCVGNPRDRFNEDLLRVFRALRFSITKQMGIDPWTSQAIREVVEHSFERFEATSTERIREEVLKMFAFNSYASFHILDDYQLLRLVHERGIWFQPTMKAKG